MVVYDSSGIEVNENWPFFCPRVLQIDLHFKLDPLTSTLSLQQTRDVCFRDLVLLCYKRLPPAQTLILSSTHNNISHPFYAAILLNILSSSVVPYSSLWSIPISASSQSWQHGALFAAKIFVSEFVVWVQHSNIRWLTLLQHLSLSRRRSSMTLLKILLLPSSPEDFTHHGTKSLVFVACGKSANIHTLA